MEFYEPDATMVPAPGQTLKGHEAIRQALTEFLAVGGTMQIETAKAVEGSGVALLSGRWRLSGKGPEGTATEVTGSSIEVARQQPDGSWKFVLDDPNGMTS